MNVLRYLQSIHLQNVVYCIWICSKAYLKFHFNGWILFKLPLQILFTSSEMWTVKTSQNKKGELFSFFLTSSCQREEIASKYWDMHHLKEIEEIPPGHNVSYIFCDVFQSNKQSVSKITDHKITALHWMIYSGLIFFIT